jgi:uncharacterized protein (UPF0333 family)
LFLFPCTTYRTGTEVKCTNTAYQIPVRLFVKKLLYILVVLVSHRMLVYFVYEGHTGKYKPTGTTSSNNKRLFVVVQKYWYCVIQVYTYKFPFLKMGISELQNEFVHFSGKFVEAAVCVSKSS